MPLIDHLAFSFSKKLPLVLQTETTECGLACLCMITGYYGFNTDMINLRRRFSVSLKGVTLANLIHVAGELELGTRPLKLELTQIKELKLPCILHWEFNHFVVLKNVTPTYLIIHDPGQGLRKLSWDAVSASFTGIALEVWPSVKFKPIQEKNRIHLADLTGKITGLLSSGIQIMSLSVTLEIFSIVAPFFLQWVIDNALVSADRDLLTTLALGFGLLMLAQQGVTALRAWILLYFGTTLNIQWRSNIFSHLIRLPVQYFEKRHIADVVSRFSAADHILHTITTSFLEAILDGTMTIITLALMFIYSLKLGLVVTAAMVLYATGRWIWYRPLRYATEEQIVYAARQQSHLLETIRGIKAIRLFQRHDERRTRWLTLMVDQINAELRSQRLQLLYKTSNGILFGIENVLVVWLGAQMVLDGNFSVGVLLAFIAYKNQFETRVSALIEKIVDVKMLQLQGDRLADIVLTDPEPSNDNFHLKKYDDLSPIIVARGLRYRYAEHEAYVLDGVDFTVSAGESVAIVGPSGCGKTTLLNILLGILPATEGEILIDGISLKQLGLDTLRKIVGTVLQDDVLFAGSIADNISFFDTQTELNWITQCAEMAAIADDIATLPMGYNTLIGDMGSALSGGQKQRILLARALYKKPKILLLDEATSHLDVDKEHQVNSAIKSLKMTRVVVAHRPETIASASRVIVLAGGKILQDLALPPSAVAIKTESTALHGEM